MYKSKVTKALEENVGQPFIKNLGPESVLLRKMLKEGGVETDSVSQTM